MNQKMGIQTLIFLDLTGYIEIPESNNGEKYVI